jgi:hypothetical protein
MRLIGKFKQGINKHEGNSQPKSKAQGMVEFALILPLLLVLLFGVIEFGRMIFVYSVVYTASREGARYGSAAGNDNAAGVPNYMDCDGIKAAAERLAILANVNKPPTIAYDQGSDADGNPINRTIGCPPGYNIEGGKHRISVEVEAEYSTFIPLPSIPETFFIRSESARTIISEVDIGIFMPPGLIVANLEGTTEGPSPWKSHVTVLVHDDFDQPQDGANVEFSWNGYRWQQNDWVLRNRQQIGKCLGTDKTDFCYCTTNGSGMCMITIIDIPNNTERVELFVTKITYATPIQYDSSYGKISIDCYKDSSICDY